MQKRWNVFPLSISYKHAHDHIYGMFRTKFINYLQGFHITAISENTLKYDISNSKEDTYHGVPLQQI